MDLQIIEIYRIYEVILCEPRLVIALEFLYGGIYKDWFAQIEFIAYGVERVEDLMGPGIVSVITDDGIPD